MRGIIVRDVLSRASEDLRSAGLGEPLSDARRLLAWVLGVSPGALLAHDDRILGPEDVARYRAALDDRLQSRPVSKIIGRRSFWTFDFLVTDDVLDPRPDTETLVEVALTRPFTRLLDLGTGSGCILLSLLHERPAATGVGTDVSPQALEVAQANCAALGLTGRATFGLADWFDGIDGRFDLIVSNPPYIAANEMACLAPEVARWDPALALTPGGDGLSAYRRIAAGALAHLTRGGRLVVETGSAQGTAVSDILAAAGLVDIAVSQDIDGRDRIVTSTAP